MFKIIAVSNRGLCNGNFAERIRAIAEEDITVILREKDMQCEEYKALLRSVKNKNIIPHTFAEAAADEGFKRLHLPLFMLKEKPEFAAMFNVGVSVHSPEEAAEAEWLGAKYLTAGHIYNTDCKKGLPGRGLEYLKSVKSSVSIPVYAIGGINEKNIKEIMNSGADGACIMSGFMQCGNVHEFTERVKKASERLI